MGGLLWKSIRRISKKICVYSIYSVWYLWKNIVFAGVEIWPFSTALSELNVGQKKRALLSPKGRRSKTKLNRHSFAKWWPFFEVKRQTYPIADDCLYPFIWISLLCGFVNIEKLKGVGCGHFRPRELTWEDSILHLSGWSVFSNLPRRIILVDFTILSGKGSWLREIVSVMQ